MSKNKVSRVVTAAAMTGLFAGMAAVQGGCANKDNTASGSAGMKATDKNAGAHACAGMNECKGQGGCKTGDMGCKGKNTCKGHGGCKTTM